MALSAGLGAKTEVPERSIIRVGSGFRRAGGIAIRLRRTLDSAIAGNLVEAYCCWAICCWRVRGGGWFGEGLGFFDEDGPVFGDGEFLVE